MIDIIKRFEKAFPELFWHAAKGRLSVDEPIYAATINTTGGAEISAGESNVSLDDAFAIAFRKSGLEWPEQDDSNAGAAWKSIDQAKTNGSEYLLRTAKGVFWVGAWRKGLDHEPSSPVFGWRTLCCGRFSTPVICMEIVRGATLHSMRPNRGERR